MMVLACGALLCLGVILSVFLGTRQPQPPSVSPKADAHCDQTTTLGSEQADVVVVAVIPLGQACVAPTVQALRQLVDMYPQELFVALVDMETEFTRGFTAPVSFRGIDPTDTAELRRVLGYPPDEDAPEDEEETGAPPAERAPPTPATDLLAAIEQKERESADDPGMGADETPVAELSSERRSALYCASIAVNGDTLFEVPGGAGEEARQVVLSGPHGTLYTAADVKAVVEATIGQRYGALPEPRQAWTPIAYEPVPGGATPLFPENRPRD